MIYLYANYVREIIVSLCQIHTLGLFVIAGHESRWDETMVTVIRMESHYENMNRVLSIIPKWLFQGQLSKQVKFI